MPTETAEQIPATTPEVPSTQTVESLLYGGPANGVQAEPSVQDKPAQTQDTEPAPAQKPDASPPAPAKPEEPPKAPEDKEKDSVAEQLKAQTRANKQLGREHAELRQKFDLLMQKHEELIARANGEEPPKKPEPTQAQRDAMLDFKARDVASQPDAFEMFGEEEVVKSLYSPDNPYVELVEQRPDIHLWVTRQPKPAVAAMIALRNEPLLKKYGHDLTKWADKILAEHKPKLFEEFQKQYTAPPVGAPVPTISEARNNGGDGSAKREKSLADYLYGGTK